MQNISVTNPLSRKVGVALFVTIIVALQAFTTFVRPFFLPITLALPLIIIGAAVYGMRNAAVLGAAFGSVVLMSGMTGTAPVSAMTWSLSPVITILATIGRGAIVGLAAGAVYAALSKKSVLAGILAAAIVAPVVNTGLFIAVMVLLFQNVLTHFDVGTTFVAVFGAWVGVNFLIELAVNLALAPWIVNIAMMVKKSNQS
ncbi:MAG: ECF transporter S component [Oscillospiraceae bacterium]|nr:ECF transporter S component [Oscillospiraceae bacterium]